MTADAHATDFVHLRLHSQYSLLTAPLTIEDAVAAAKADGQTALALTDDGNLFGAIEFYQACQGAGMKPILGMNAYVAGRSHKEPTSADNQTFPLTLLAENNTGWANLRRLSSIAYLEGFHYRPRLDKDLLQQHGEGIIALSGTVSSETAQHLLAGRNAEALQTAGALRDIFGPDRFFLELMETGHEPQQRVNQGLLELHQRLRAPIVATHDVHYLTREDWIVQDIVLCIRNGNVVSNPERFRMGSRELYLKSRAEMVQAFAALPEAIANTVAIAERCNVKIDFNVYHLPVFDTGAGETPDATFRRLCDEGARARYGESTAAVRDRLSYEIGIIEKLGFVSYFLVVQDFIRHARSLGIPVGPGRGSAAGSIVAYVLGITNLDPLRYNLLFERFLNAARVSMPDIDIDFCGDRRDEVIGYVRDKYGKDNVSQIVTFGTMASRGVLRDVGRVLEVPLGDIDQIAKKVPQGPGASLRAALDSDKELAEIRNASETNRRLFDLGLKLEGMVRHTSIHAAGVVVADRPLIDYVPLARNGEDITTQWQMEELEQVGLLKMDFLGLKTLTILHEAVRLIAQTRGQHIDLDHLPLEDAPTYRLMTDGDTLGVFQLESQGMRDLLARLKPDTFEDVIAVLALYRPGPLQSGMVDMFVRRKHGEEATAYPHPSLQPILEETYGVIVYQEQVMRIANVLAGFSLNDADNLRKAMGKKRPEVMAKFKQQFVDGAAHGGHDRTFAKELFETIEYFAGYGFNKSHSAAYALLTYQTAYLKAHHPVEFYAANLTVESGTSDKVKEFIDAARRGDTVVLPPDVNHSSRRFGVEKASVRFGLGAVKGVGTRTAEAIGEERESGGAYRSFDDFCERHDSSVLNKTSLEALVRAGAFDGFGETRAVLFESVDTALRSSARARDDRRKGQKMLFATPGTERPTAASEAKPKRREWTEHERLAHEKEALGFYFSGHPFEKRGRFLQRLAGLNSSRLAELRSTLTDRSVRLAGMVSGVRILQIKSGRNAGQKMARFFLEDLEGRVPVTCFAKAYQECKDAIVEDAISIMTARLDAQSEELALLLESIEPAQQVVDAEVEAIVLRLSDSWQTAERCLERIADAIARHPGPQRVELEVVDGDHVFQVRADRHFSVRVTDDLLDHLAEIVGPTSLSFTKH
ncbi:MAG: DNA polymerase III subunit alpha [Planctomycetota bacterium]